MSVTFKILIQLTWVERQRERERGRDRERERENKIFGQNKSIFPFGGVIFFMNYDNELG